MSPQEVKAKGRALQNAVARDLARVTGLTYGRPDQDDCDLKGRLMGTPGSDIVRVTEAARTAVPWFIECKARRSWTFDMRLLGLGSAAKITLYTWLKATERRQERLISTYRDVIIGDRDVLPLLVVSTGRLPQLAVCYGGWAQRPSGLFLTGQTGGRETYVMAWETFLRWQYPQGVGKKESR